ncbi:MAG: hypothetical protein LQ340_002648 [Diploschistes diacapsis]|nr:MAG: hypothetical protein LQ340_002648 [Diploschistes diacapsis]
MADVQSKNSGLQLTEAIKAMTPIKTLTESLRHPPKPLTRRCRGQRSVMPRIQLRHGLQLAKGVDVADVAVEAADAGVVKELSKTEMPGARLIAAEATSSRLTAPTVVDVVTVLHAALTEDGMVVMTGTATAGQTDQSWGAQTGGSEWDDEKAGEEIAKAEAKEGFDTSVNAPVNADGEKPDGESGQAENVPSTEPAEPEDRSKSYDAYLAEQAEKRMNLGGVLKARKPNEGNKIDKKWASAKPINQDDNEEAYIAGKEAKAGRQRERKEKQTLEIDYRYQEQSRGERGGRGGRGRGEFRGGDRGGRGESRGGDRGGRGDRGRGRGDFRGGDFRGSDFRGGDFRGGRGGGRGRGDNVNISDETAFPSLGA